MRIIPRLSSSSLCSLLETDRKRRLIISLGLIIGMGHCIAQQSTSPQELPLVYDCANTGSKYAKPEKIDFNKLKEVKNLPDPFLFADGTRSTDFKDWERHRNEIITRIEQYEIGPIPSMDNMRLDASLQGDTMLIVTVTAPNGKSIDVKARITYPKVGNAPYPAIIGIANCLPANLFLERGCALINFDFNTVCAHQQKRGSEPINILYPELVDNGAYSYWPWGVSRLIDGLERLGVRNTRIDTHHLAVSGCSWGGKAALFSGAFDERICLVIPQEPGGGGAASWRVSETLGNVERVHNTDGHWFLESMKTTFGEANVSKLPTDHHALAALVAPRALLLFGNPDYKWLADESMYVTCKAVKEVYRTFGIADRFAYSIRDKHNHCMLPKEDYQYVEAFIDRFLLGKSATTDVELAPMFAEKDWKQWMW